MNLQPNEIRDITRLLEQGKALPDKYRFLLFDDKRQVELVWNGKTDEVTNVVLPFQTIEHIDEPRTETDKIKLQRELFDTSGRQVKGWTNKLIWGDNKLILSALKNGPMRKEIEAAGGIKLIYIDPPFDVGADFSMNIEIGDEEFTKKPSVIEEVAYRDTWGKGADSFIAMIYERLKIMQELLADDGSVYVHCDWRLSCHLRIVLDEIFGKENFLNEIIWRYEGPQAPSPVKFGSKHDTILRYAKNREQVFCGELYFLEEEPFEAKKYQKDDLGRYFYTIPKGDYSDASIARLDAEGKIFRNSNGTARIKRFVTLSGDGTKMLKEKKIPDVWDITSLGLAAGSKENVGYPTQKPEALLERIIKASSSKGDLVTDFFIGSGTTLSIAEKFGRKWIGTDLGRFSIHTSRKRMIEVQRQLKKEGKDFRAFEILNLGRYERKQFVKIDGDLRAKEKEQLLREKEAKFVDIVLQAYKAEPIANFRNFIGKKRDRLVAIGPIEFPVTHSFIESVVEECREKGISKVDVLGFEYEMGVDLAEPKKFGIDVQFKRIPNEVFDKRAVERDQVRFYDVAFIEVMPVIKKNSVAIELTNFSVFYNQDDVSNVEQTMKGGASKVVLENGCIIKLSKDKGTDIVTREVLTKKWTDWIDYWAVDFDYESKKEVVKTLKDDGTESEEWTGQYVFENEWQSFRTRKNRELDFTSVAKEVKPGRRKVAVKVIDIFGNDTTKIIEVNV